MSYSDKLKDPRWQKKRLEIMERDGWACVVSGRTDETLVVHHMRYHGNPWDAPNEELETLCDNMHGIITPFARIIQSMAPKKAYSAKEIYAALELAIEDIARREFGGDKEKALEVSPNWHFELLTSWLVIGEDWETSKKAA